MKSMQKRQSLQLSSSVVEACLVVDAHEYFVEDAIVLNVSQETITIGSYELSSCILPWKSSRLFNSVINSAERIVVFKVAPNADLSLLGQGEWDWFGDRLPTFPRTTGLYISPVDRIGGMNLDLTAFTGRPFSQHGSPRYDVRLNLWFAPAGTDCGIHNTHDFLEIHTQIVGTGKIEKFKTRELDTKFEELFLTPGQTHNYFGDLDKNAAPTYPWHRYIATTDCVWLAIEFHPLEWFPFRAAYK